MIRLKGEWEMQKKNAFIVGFLLSIHLLLISCNNSESGSPAKGTEFDEDLVSAAMETSSEFNASNIPKTIDQFNEIPVEYWVPEIEAMEPINVYSHNNNIAIVLEETETEEKGIYVNVPFSSYAPISDDNVAFTAIESFIYAFVRKK